VLGPTATPRALRKLRYAPHDERSVVRHRRMSCCFARTVAPAAHMTLCTINGRSYPARQASSTGQARRLTPLTNSAIRRGSELIAHGQRVEIVQRVLGHRDIRSTFGYAELPDEQVRAALEAGITL
jgi:hypothetical protein